MHRFKFNQFLKWSLLLVCSTLLIHCQTTSSQKTKSKLVDVVDISDAQIVLRHFVQGTVPEFQQKANELIHPSTETLALPGYCFCRCLNHTDENHDVYVCFQSNTEAFLIPFAESIQRLPVSEKTYLDDRQTVEKWVYGEQWAVIVNFGEDDYLYQTTLLPQYGFIALGPGFLAQHYYPHADEDTTALFVQHHDEKYDAF